MKDYDYQFVELRFNKCHGMFSCTQQKECHTLLLHTWCAFSRKCIVYSQISCEKHLNFVLYRTTSRRFCCCISFFSYESTLYTRVRCERTYGSNLVDLAYRVAEMHRKP